MSFYILLLCLAILLWCVYARWKYSGAVILAEKLDGPYAYPIIGNALSILTRNPLHVMEKMAAEYGHLKLSRVWMSFRVFIMPIDPEVIETILNSKAALDKGPSIEMLRPIFDNGLIASDSAVWHYNRRIVAPAFNIFRIKTYIEAFTQESEKVAHSWKAKVGTKFSPYYDSVGLFFSFPLRTAMGDKVFQKVTNSMDLYHFAYAAREISEIVAQRFFNPLLIISWLFMLTPAYRKMRRLLAMYDNLLQEMVRAKREENDDDNTFLSHLIQAEKIYPKFQQRQILDELKTYVSAGFETTATTANLVFIMLGIHSEIQEKVYQEQMEILGGVDKEPTFDDLNKMVYLEQVIKETLRLFPTIPMFVRETNEEIKVCDKIIPKGCNILLTPYIVHRIEEIYPNPLLFNPDRFRPEEEKKRHPYSFLGFSAGPRACIGQRYAMYSMKAFISSIIKRYRISTDYGLDYIHKTIKTAIELLVDNYEITISERQNANKAALL